MPPVSLDRAAVFCDFDGTLTTADVGVHVLERLAPPEWHEVEAEYDAGEIGSRICLLEEWDLLPRDESAIRAAAGEVGLVPGAIELLAALRAAGAEVTIVSDGFGFYVEQLLGDAPARLGVQVMTNAVDWASGALSFPHEDRCCACSSCGTCKQAPIKDARHRGLTTVLIGDGTSDRKAALVSDVVFATGPLARWCAGNGVTFEPFTTLADVARALDLTMETPT
jgi:2,3-diketo-5-methylthio-1-phosphopentane phosphatase